MRKSPEPKKKKKKTVTQQKNPRGGGRTRLGAVRYLWEGEGEIPKRWADTVELAIRRSTRCQRHGAVPLYGVNIGSQPSSKQVQVGMQGPAMHLLPQSVSQLGAVAAKIKDEDAEEKCSQSRKGRTESVIVGNKENKKKGKIRDQTGQGRDALVTRHPPQKAPGACRGIRLVW